MRVHACLTCVKNGKKVPTAKLIFFQIDVRRRKTRSLGRDALRLHLRRGECVRSADRRERRDAASLELRSLLANGERVRARAAVHDKVARGCLLKVVLDANLLAKSRRLAARRKQWAARVVEARLEAASTAHLRDRVAVQATKAAHAIAA